MPEGGLHYWAAAKESHEGLQGPPQGSCEQGFCGGLGLHPCHTRKEVHVQRSFTWLMAASSSEFPGKLPGESAPESACQKEACFNS